MRMRTSLFCLAVAAQALTACAQLAAQDATGKNATDCSREVKSSPEGQVVYARLWAFDDADSVAKLNDPEPLSKEQQNALAEVHKKNLQCRKITPVNSDRYIAWATPYREEYFQRGEAIFNKLVRGEIPVGLANRLAIESNGKFLDDVSRGHADAVRSEEIQRQQAAEALLQASAASQPRPGMAAANCTWFDNALNCTKLR